VFLIALFLENMRANGNSDFQEARVGVGYV
jgi:hypothetical protein